MKGISALLLFAASLVAAPFASNPPNAHEFALPSRVPLWPDGAPDAKANTPLDQPDITVYPIGGSQKTNSAVIVFPGGGYVNLAVDHEGVQIASWLNSYGVTAFVVRYRLGPQYHHPVELGDAQRAVRWVRAHAGDYGFDPHQIGVWGFSAGGHLASSVGTHFDAGKPDPSDPIDRQSCRPDFLILAYPVITFQEPYLHRGSRDSLLGKNADPELVRSLSNELQVTKDTPPTFLFHTSDDAVVPVQNSLMFYEALRAAHVDAEMHIFEHGPHGVGLARDKPELSQWPDLLAHWLRARGLLNPHRP
jgi:acetyl esterase/lipase